MEDLTPSACLKPTRCVDANADAVQRFMMHAIGGEQDPRLCAIKLYYAVRDGFRYDPYRLEFTHAGMRASRVLENGYGHCIAKAVLLAASARAAGIPARLGFADVRNHLTSPRLRDLMQSDVFAWHGYTELFLEEKWVKATPAFDLALCDRVHILPLEFDGRTDSLYHPFDASGRKHMEYIKQRGLYADVPLEEIVTTYLEMYPRAAAHYREALPEAAVFAEEAESE